VELEALHPDDLRGLYEAVLTGYRDPDSYAAVLAVEEADYRPGVSWVRKSPPTTSMGAVR
jgi:hypothetical protein